jgi:hypothetical protein
MYFFRRRYFFIERALASCMLESNDQNFPGLFPDFFVGGFRLRFELDFLIFLYVERRIQ